MSVKLIKAIRAAANEREALDLLEAAQSRPPSTQSAGMVATADPRPWDHVDDVLPVIELMRSGKWAWVENMRCKYIELRIDTRDGGCIIRDREKVRITPEQLANQPYGGHGEPWAPPPAGGGKEALSDAERDAKETS